jgi:hypothetical protein
MSYSVLVVARAPRHLPNFQFVFPVVELDASDSLAAWRAAPTVTPAVVRLEPDPALGVVVAWSGGAAPPGRTAAVDIELYGPGGAVIPVADSLGGVHRLLGGGVIPLVVQPLVSLRHAGPIPTEPPDASEPVAA